MHFIPLPWVGGKMHLGRVIFFLLRGLKLPINLVIVQMLAITYFLSQFFFQVSLLLIKIQKIFRFCVALLKIQILGLWFLDILSSLSSQSPHTASSCMFLAFTHSSHCAHRRLPIFSHNNVPSSKEEHVRTLWGVLGEHEEPRRGAYGTWEECM